VPARIHILAGSRDRVPDGHPAGWEFLWRQKALKLKPGFDITNPSPTVTIPPAADRPRGVSSARPAARVRFFPYRPRCDVPDADARGLALEQFRDYLHLLGRLRLNGVPDSRVDLSGVVQQTLLEAHQAGDRFPAGADPGQAAWLRTAFAHNLADALRRAGAAARDPARERSLEELFEESSARATAWLAADQSSPSQRADRAEQLIRLAGALARLPDDQRLAVELHHLQGWPVAEVAARMDRTRESVAGLLFRGLRRLRELLDA
jgi:RNA polymerase sigma-70 factor (ECF subfamily)